MTSTTSLPSSHAANHGVAIQAKDGRTTILARAVALHREGRLDAAEPLYRQVLATAPRHADALQFLGVLTHQKGDSDGAIRLLKKALRIEPDNASCHNNLGSVYSARGDLARAEHHFRKSATGHAPSAEAWSNLGLVQRRRSDLDSAVESFRAAIDLDPAYPAPHRELGALWLARRCFDLAERALRAYLDLVPDDMMAANNLAYSVQQQGRLDEAETLFQQGMERAGGAPELGYNLRVLMTLQGRGDEARDLFRRQIREKPELWSAELGLALNLARRGMMKEALANLEDILEVHKDEAVVANDIGMVLIELGKLRQAIEVLRRAVELDPDLAVAHNNLASAYTLAHHSNEAVAEFRKAIRAKPDFVDPYVNLTRALRSAGKFDEANMFGRAAISLDGYDNRHFPNMLQVFRSTCDFDALRHLGDVWDNCDALPVHALPSVFLDLLVSAGEDRELERFVALVRRWAEHVEAGAAQAPLPPAEPGAAGSKLRIGFLSSDLRHHSVSRFLIPLMRTYDRERFEFFCYTPLRDTGDTIQELFKTSVDSFTFVENRSSWEIARTIRDDRVDILFELNGFTQATRLEALAWRPAPVQVSWLGYPFTCGLSTLDHVLLDRFVAPEDGRYLVEEPVIMPGAWVCFGRFADVGIAPGLPMDRYGGVTFGTLNSPYKYTERMIANWAAVMKRVPGSRFLMVRPEARSYTICKNITDVFAREGIGADRIYLFDNRTQKRNHLAYYNEIDVSLDTAPLTGGTTTCEATWMGVPVVSLVGPSFQQRISYSALMQCGLEELCTFDEAAFVERAVEIAGDRDRLLAWRHGLRDLMSASPLCDEERFVFQFQEMLEQLAAHHGLR